MSVFTENELAYMQSQRLARLATVRPDCAPQIAPVGFRYNAELDVIDIGGRYMSQTKKFRNIQQNASISLVIDDMLPSWQARGIEIRGTAESIAIGGKAIFGTPNYEVDDTFIRITPVQIIGWGLDNEAGWSKNRKVERK